MELKHFKVYCHSRATGEVVHLDIYDITKMKARWQFEERYGLTHKDAIIVEMI